MAKYSAEQLRQMLARGQAMRNPSGDPSFPIGDTEDLQNAIHAVGLGGASNNAIRRYIMGRAKAMGKTSMIPDTWQADGSLRTRSRDETLPVREFARTWDLADVHVRQDGAGRTVQAYVTPFDHPTEISDVEGHYEEQIARNAFHKTLAERGLNFAVLYNHGRTFDGRTDGNLMIPIGVPRLLEAHDRGLYSETEFLENPLADATLDAIRKGALRGYSFTGRFMKSQRTRGERLGLPTVTRSEVAMREYGPVLFPAYDGALIVGTRMADLISHIEPDDVDRLRELLGIPAARQPADVSATPSGAGLSSDPAQRQSTWTDHSIRLARIKRGME